LTVCTDTNNSAAIGGHDQNARIRLPAAQSLGYGVKQLIGGRVAARGLMGVAERHTCLVLRLARACSEVPPVAADRVGIWMTGSGRSRGRCTRRLTRTGSAPTRWLT
jgi:hypothetical protein